MLPDSLKNLIEAFKYLPGIGEKTAERLTFAVLELDEEQVEFFSDSLLDVFKNIKKCKLCNTLTEDDICYVCNNKLRDDELLCVVEDTKSVFLFERLGMFNGKYHVLEGLINPLEGINPEDIGLSNLIDRIHNEKFKEIIFAFKPSIEGETTALYIKRILDGLDIKITRLAFGLPVGGKLDYADTLTISKALEGRKEI